MSTRRTRPCVSWPKPISRLINGRRLTRLPVGGRRYYRRWRNVSRVSASFPTNPKTQTHFTDEVFGEMEAETRNGTTIEEIVRLHGQWVQNEFTGSRCILE